jgi:type VI secretion system protein ImpC
VDWRAFRETSASRFVGLVLPRYLARLPYGPANRAEGVEYFEEAAEGPDGRGFVWGSAAYLLAGQISRALGERGWPTDITGWQGGGRLSDLPVYTAPGARGRAVAHPPTDVVIDGLLEPILAWLGFIALQWNKGTTDGVIDAAPSVHRPKPTNNEKVNADAAVGARLPALLAACQVNHRLKRMLKKMVGMKWGAHQIHTFLNDWVKRYVSSTAPLEPLRQARVEVNPDPKRPGWYFVKVFLEPWIGIEGVAVDTLIGAFEESNTAAG